MFICLASVFAMMLAGCSEGGNTPVDPTPSGNYYTVRWENYDGTLLEEDKNVKEGTEPTYDGATPTRESTAEYAYTFEGWSPKLEKVTEDITYTATYSSAERKYTITWKNED